MSHATFGRGISGARIHVPTSTGQQFSLPLHQQRTRNSCGSTRLVCRALYIVQAICSDRLRLSLTDAAISEEVAAGTQLSQDNEKSMRVLIVEDNAGIRRLIRRTLLGIASSIWECCDGFEALTTYATQRPDVVLMDIQMPGLDGLTATRRIRALDPHARVLVLTDHDDDDLRRAAVEAGACGYLLKQDLSDLPITLLNISVRTGPHNL
jgi:CheY-like chemotaxis protein